ncbi:tetratricopeptide repeat protein [Psychroflexus sp. ALD_RP9]|nr:tetratricopeptide repeat protein [Psychroflexus sp. ALD_RP9]
MKTIMKNLTKLIILFFAFSFMGVFAQSKANSKTQKRLLAEAYEKAKEGDFANAEADYRKALATPSSKSTAAYNFANLYIDNDKVKSAQKRILDAIEGTDDKSIKHKAFHNLGNTFMKEKKYQAAVEAYKNALRNNPNDEETRYNYALAKEKLKKEKNDGGGDGDDKKDQNKDQNKKDQKDQSKDDNSKKDQKDKGDQKDQDKKEGNQDKQKDNKQEDGNQNKDKKSNKPKKSKDGQGKDNPQQKPQKGKLSPEQVQRLLKAIQNQENKIQEKVNAKKAKGSKVKTEKDW